MIRRFPAVCLFVCACLAALFCPGPSAAQTPSAPAALSAQADALFDRRQYREAIAAYGQLLQKYPTSEYNVDARFHLAYAQFLTGDFDPAAAGLRTLLTSPTSPPELLELAAGLLPQVESQQAGALPPEDPGRTAAFETAIREYDGFITKYPRSATLETALYGRALDAYQIARYEDAARLLRQTLAAFPTGETVLDNEFLLSVTLATQARLALGREGRSPADADAAFRNYAEAERLLTDIITRRTDISLANDAQFQLGETLLAHAGGTTPEAARGPLYQQALAAYRAVQPKEGMIAAQTALVARFNDARITELRKGAATDHALTRRLDARRLREQSRLETLQAKDDPVLTARLQCGAVFYNLQRFDETRVLMAALAPVVRRADDEKLVLYYTALSYAGQRLTDKAVAAYDKFQAKFKGDPIAENLPILLGNLFLAGPRPDAARATAYFDEFTRLYPKSTLRDAAMLQQAEAAASLGHYDDALRTLTAFLEGKPRPELVAAAQLGRARILKDKKDLDGALAVFRQVRDQNPGRPEGEEAAFWVGWTRLQKKDAAGAVGELKTFAAQHPQSQRLPAALFTLGQAQQAAGAAGDALATFADLAARFPQSAEAPGAYFQRANLYLADKKYDDLARVLTEFVGKYPDNDQAFAACEQIAAVRAQAGRIDDAVAVYEQFVTRRPDAPRASDAVARQAALWLRAARGLGSFIVLGPADRETWTHDVKNSVTAAERALARYPDAPATGLALQTLADAQRLLVEARQQSEAQVADYFRALAAKNADHPAARSRILFRLAALTLDKDPARALADMRAAYDPAVVYSPADLDALGTGLLKTDPDEAAAVFEKAAKDYPLPPGTAPALAPPEVQDAQALALYGHGTLAETAGRRDEAVRDFTDLKRDYPRSSKVPEANLGLAQGLIAAGKGDDALPLLSEVARSSTASVEARARALFLNGEVQASKGQDGAIDAYLKVAAFYPASPDAPEGLWKGGQLLEKQAALLGDIPAKPGGPTKPGQLARARKAYEELTTRYDYSKWARQARAHLAALTAGK